MSFTFPRPNFDVQKNTVNPSANAMPIGNVTTCVALLRWLGEAGR